MSLQCLHIEVCLDAQAQENTQFTYNDNHMPTVGMRIKVQQQFFALIL